MRRRVFTLALFLLLGAVLNVAVAWPATLTRNINFQALPLEDELRLWSEHTPSGWPSSDGEGKRLVTANLTCDVAYSAYNQPNGLAIARYREGWPMRAVQGYVLFGQSGSPRGSSAVNAIQLRVWPIYPGYFLLALEPLWPGFAINTTFYAAILWPLISGPFALRRLIRRKRGVCVACGYDIRHAEHDVCPECGADRSL